jgi:carboxyl-terminal processing protease
MIKKASLLVAGALAGAALTFSFSQTPSNYAEAAGNAETFNQLKLFGDVFERVLSDYVEKPDETKLIEAAINGMLTSLDPHSSYLSPDHFRDMQVQTRGEFGGLGIQVTMEEGLVKVVSPIDDTPAAAAKIEPNDLITHLDGEPVKGLTLEQAVKKMRGPVGTDIELTILREDSEPFKVTITRDTIKVKSVRHELKEDVGYIRITTFNEQTSPGLEEAISALQKEVKDGNRELKGYILDLRNNPGGLLNQSIEVADAFLNRGEIVSTRGRHADETRRFNARAGDVTENKPVVVLINGGSASASEIVAGALQDHQRATVVGTRSFGKGSVQTVVTLTPNSAIRLTTARYYTPQGTSIQAKGISPDIEVKQNVPEDLKDKARTKGEAGLRGHLNADDGEEYSGSSVYEPENAEEDLQLNYALKLLRGEEIHTAFPPGQKKTVPN